MRSGIGESLFAESLGKLLRQTAKVGMNGGKEVGVGITAVFVKCLRSQKRNAEDRLAREEKENEIAALKRKIAELEGESPPSDTEE